MKTPKFNKISRQAAIIASIAILLCALWETVVSKNITFGLYDTPLLTLLIVVVVMATIYTLLTSLPGKLKSKKLRLLTRTVVIISIIALGILGFGLAQDLLGIKCTGFFGAEQRCIESSIFSAVIIFLHPVSFLTLITLTTIMLILGWREQLSKPASKNRRG